MTKLRRRVGVLGIATALSIYAAVLLYFVLPEKSGFNLAIATSVPVICLILCGMFARPSLTDATFIFMIWAFMYQVVEPWLLVRGVAQVAGSVFFEGNYRLLALGNVYFTAGLVAYGLGMLVCPQPIAQSSSRELLGTGPNAKRVVFAVLFISVLSWLVLWLRAETPKEAFLLIRPMEVTRNQEYVAYGYGYLIDLAFGTNLALLIYTVLHPSKSLLSAQVLGLLACVIFVNGMRGSRVVFFLAPLSVLLLKYVVYLRSAVRLRPGTKGHRRRGFAIGFVAIVCLLAMLPYTEYREGTAARAELVRFGWATMLAADATNLFWSSLTYYMVLDRVPSEHPYWHGRGYAAPLVSAVPRIIFPDKARYLWNDHQFVLDFFGYDEWAFGATAKGGDLLAYQYLNFGIIGVVGEMFVLGLINEYLSRKARSQFAGRLFTVMYVFYITYFLLELWKNGLANAVNFSEVVVFEVLVIAWLVGRAGTIGTVNSVGRRRGELSRLSEFAPRERLKGRLAWSRWSSAG